MTELLKYTQTQTTLFVYRSSQEPGTERLPSSKINLFGISQFPYNPGEFDHQLDWGTYFTLSVYPLSTIEAESGQRRIWLRAGIKLYSLLVYILVDIYGYLLIRLKRS